MEILIQLYPNFSAHPCTGLPLLGRGIQEPLHELARETSSTMGDLAELRASLNTSNT